MDRDIKKILGNKGIKTFKSFSVFNTFDIAAPSLFKSRNQVTVDKHVSCYGNTNAETSYIVYCIIQQQGENMYRPKQGRFKQISFTITQ